jgi:hypothetical protein
MHFCKPTLAIVISSILFSCNHSNTLTFPVIKANEQFTWTAVAKKVPHNIAVKFIKDHPDCFEAYRRNDEFSSIDSLYPRLHFLDINNDGRDDIFFDGASGGEANMIQIFVDVNGSYKEVFKDMQGVAKIDWDDKKMAKLYILDWGCCDDFAEFEKIYDVSFTNDNIPQFKLVYQAASVYNAPQPANVFDKPFAFEVVNENYNLRAEPVLDDTSVQHWNVTPEEEENNKGKGNIIAKLPAGTKGMAVGKKVDNAGREWWYVEIDEDAALRNNAMYENENKLPAKTIGWISSRFVKKL